MFEEQVTLGSLFYAAAQHGYKAQQATSVRCKAISADELNDLEIPKPTFLLSPWLTSSSLSMIYAWRGVGKTQVAMGIAQAVASGTEFLGWHAASPSEVLYVDGELPLYTLQERLKQSDDIFSERRAALTFITPELQEGGMPNLADATGRAAVEEHIGKDTKLVILDNLSSLVRGNKENEAESWDGIQEWLISLRSRGIAVILIHHASKSGEQRGTSKREDILDVSIELKHPQNYNAAQGCVFELHFKKSRHCRGEDVESKLVKNIDFGWQVFALEESGYDAFKDYANANGLSNERKLDYNDARTALNMSKSSVYNHAKRFQREAGIQILRPKTSRKGF